MGKLIEFAILLILLALFSAWMVGVIKFAKRKK